MTLSWPSLLAAAASLSIPPRAPALVAVAAPVDPSVFFAGGAHAAADTVSTEVARRAAARTNEVCTVPPSRRSGTGPALLLTIVVHCGRRGDNEPVTARRHGGRDRAART